MKKRKMGREDEECVCVPMVGEGGRSFGPDWPWNPRIRTKERGTCRGDHVCRPMSLSH